MLTPLKEGEKPLAVNTTKCEFWGEKNDGDLIRLFLKLLSETRHKI